MGNTFAWYFGCPIGKQTSCYIRGEDLQSHFWNKIIILKFKPLVRFAGTESELDKYPVTHAFPCTRERRKSCGHSLVYVTVTPQFPGDCSQDPHGHQNPKMLKSLVLSGIIFVYNLLTSSRRFQATSTSLTIPNAMPMCWLKSCLCGKCKHCSLGLSGIFLLV